MPSRTSSAPSAFGNTNDVKTSALDVSTWTLPKDAATKRSSTSPVSDSERRDAALNDANRKSSQATTRREFDITCDSPEAEKWTMTDDVDGRALWSTGGNSPVTVKFEPSGW